MGDTAIQVEIDRGYGYTGGDRQGYGYTGGDRWGIRVYRWG